MAPELRKRPAQSEKPSLKDSDDTYIDDDDNGDDDDDDDSSHNPLKTRERGSFARSCPICGSGFDSNFDLRTHYRRHKGVEMPFTCTYPGCTNTKWAVRAKLSRHICRIHLRIGKESLKEANKFIDFSKELFDAETIALGLDQPKNSPVVTNKTPEFTGLTFNKQLQQEKNTEKAVEVDKELAKEVQSDETEEEEEKSDEVEFISEQPHFSIIYQTPSGNYVCPNSDCNHEVTELSKLKVHYRKRHAPPNHCPYKCTFNDRCTFKANRLIKVKQHIQAKHMRGKGDDLPEVIEDSEEDNEDNDNVDENLVISSEFSCIIVDTAFEDEVFSRVKVLPLPSPPPTPNKKRKRIRKRTTAGQHLPHRCPFRNCTAAFESSEKLRRHFEHDPAHQNVTRQPFYCTFVGCTMDHPVKRVVLEHVAHKHFGVPPEQMINLTEEERRRDERFVGLRKNMLKRELEQAEEASQEARVELERKQRILQISTKAKFKFKYDSLADIWHQKS